jgi:tight adherence protein C
MTHVALTAAGGFCLVFMGASAVMLRIISRREARLAQRIKFSRGIEPTAEARGQSLVKRAWDRFVALLGQAILRTGLLSARTRAELEVTLQSSGLRGRKGLEIFIGSKITMALALPSLVDMVEHVVAFPPMLKVIVPATALVVGLLSPDSVVRYRRNSYVKRVEQGLPDALDLLVICSQAGLGLTAAISRVAEEMQQGREPVGVELAITANELQFIDTRTALLSLGSRTNIRGLVRLGTTLVQSMQFGTPLTEAMRQLCGEMRQEALTRFEAKAARLGVLLTMPMIVFILPCVFLIVGGPAAVQIMQIGK